MYSHPSKHNIKTLTPSVAVGQKAAPAFQTLPPSVAVAACRFNLASSGAIQLTPAGKFAAKDGRPFGSGQWFIDDTTAQKILVKLKARQDKLVIDYEHQTLNADKNGQPAPAAGWINGADVEWRSGEGFFVTPEWTAAAKAFIDNKEYQYFSPVMLYKKDTGEVTDIIMGAVTNNAAIDGMQHLEAQAAAKYTILTPQPQEDNPMDEKIRALLGLEKDASDDQVQVALTALVKKDKDTDIALAAAKAQTPDDAMEVMKEMQIELTALKSQFNDNEIDVLIQQGIDKKVLASDKQIEHARKVGGISIALLKRHIDVGDPIAALKGNQSDGKEPNEKQHAELDATALAVCKSMGIDPADYAKTAQTQQELN